MFLYEKSNANLLVFSNASRILMIVIPCAYVQVINTIIDSWLDGLIYSTQKMR